MKPSSILLIDDSGSVREVLRVALESEGYRVLDAADGREGVRLYREHRPALVLVDIVMPEKDGIETVKEILAIDPAAVIFTMSGKDGAEDHNEVTRMLGARRTFEKPLSPCGLVVAVNAVLSLDSSRRPARALDLGRITTNPFDYKQGLPDRESALRQSLEILDRFFEYPEEAVFYETMNRLISAQGAKGFVRLTFSARHVADVTEEIRQLPGCPGGHSIWRIERILILLHIGLIELVERGSYLGFHQWLQRKLNDELPQLPKAGTRNSLKEYLEERNREYLDQHGSSRAFRTALQLGLVEGAQVQLFRGFAFSEEYDLGMPQTDSRHVHCADRVKRKVPYDSICTGYCQPPTPEEVRRLIPRLADHLYGMRSAFVHNASGLGFAPAGEKPRRGFGTRMFFDAYFTGAGRLVSYQVTMDRAALIVILKQCIWTRLSTANP